MRDSFEAFNPHIVRCDVIDLTIASAVGAAFTRIVNSLISFLRVAIARCVLIVRALNVLEAWVPRKADEAKLAVWPECSTEIAPDTIRHRHRITWLLSEHAAVA